MSAIVEFLKVLGHLLRSGKMSYGDALTRFRAQFGRPAEGMEKVAIMKEVEKAPSNVIDFPKDRITDWWKPRPGSGKCNGLWHGFIKTKSKRSSFKEISKRNTQILRSTVKRQRL